MVDGSNVNFTWANEEGVYIAGSEGNSDAFTAETDARYFLVVTRSYFSLQDITLFAEVNPSVVGTSNADDLVVTGIAILDAGAGDDAVVAGLGNVPSSDFSGGEGYDSLDLTVAAYAVFDYRSASFEVATLRSVDGSVLGRYKQDGTRDFYTQYDAEGSEPWSRQVTIEDAAKDALWQSKVFTYADNGQLISVDTNNGENILTYNPDNTPLTWSLR